MTIALVPDALADYLTHPLEDVDNWYSEEDGRPPRSTSYQRLPGDESDSQQGRQAQAQWSSENSAAAEFSDDHCACA